MGLGLQNMKGVDRWLPLVKWINVCGRRHMNSGQKRTVSSRWTRARDSDSCSIFLDPVCRSSGTIIMISMLLKQGIISSFWRLMLTIESGFEIRSRTSRTDSDCGYCGYWLVNAWSTLLLADKSPDLIKRDHCIRVYSTSDLMCQCQRRKKGQGRCENTTWTRAIQATLNPKSYSCLKLTLHISIWPIRTWKSLIKTLSAAPQPHSPRHRSRHSRFRPSSQESAHLRSNSR